MKHPKKRPHEAVMLPRTFYCPVGKSEIIATFHTHPNITDSRAVRDDLDLKGEFYEGEFVVSQTTIYFIAPDGRVSEIGATQAIFG